MSSVDSIIGVYTIPAGILLLIPVFYIYVWIIRQIGHLIKHISIKLADIFLWTMTILFWFVVLLLLFKIP